MYVLFISIGYDILVLKFAVKYRYLLTALWDLAQSRSKRDIYPYWPMAAQLLDDSAAF